MTVPAACRSGGRRSARRADRRTPATTRTPSARRARPRIPCRRRRRTAAAPPSACRRAARRDGPERRSRRRCSGSGRRSPAARRSSAAPWRRCSSRCGCRCRRRPTRSRDARSPRARATPSRAGRCRCACRPRRARPCAAADRGHSAATLLRRLCERPGGSHSSTASDVRPSPVCRRIVSHSSLQQFISACRRSPCRRSDSAGTRRRPRRSTTYCLPSRPM